MDRRSVLKAGAGLCVILNSAPLAFAADKGAYEKIIKEVIQAAASKNLGDIDGLLAKLDTAAKIGVEFCKEVAAADAAGKPILDFVIASFDKIRATPTEKFEEQWHEGAAFKAAGFDPSKFEQTGKVASSMDSIIHPLTARAALAAYKTSPKPELLKTVVSELEEVLGHLAHL